MLLMKIGKIPRNFLINISGLIGTPTGIFKSTMGLQIAFHIDKLFNLKTRVAFSINELLDKIKQYTEIYMTNEEYAHFKQHYKGSYEIYESDKKGFDKLLLLTKLIFFLDEQTKTLKIGGMTRLQNLIDTCRQRQICFIVCGVESYDMHFSTYNLLRVQESSDEDLPLKRVRYAVHDSGNDIFYGYFSWDVTPLTDPTWQIIWKQYSAMKTKFQRIAIDQSIDSMDYENMANEITQDVNYEKCFRYTKEGKKLMLNALMKSLIIKRFPDLTRLDQTNILSELKFSQLA